MTDIGCPRDTDRDGVLDGSDLCPDTAPGKEVDETGCEKRAPIVLRGVNFELNSDRLTEDSQGILNVVAESLRAHPKLRLEVAGHTDSLGRAEFNMDLSQRRAESVRRYLVEQGVAPGNLTARGYGEEMPVADNSTREGRAENRRVELNRLDH